MKKILLYAGVPNIGNPGGTERVFCEMANALTARGHEVYAVCNDVRPVRPFYPLDDRVHFINLDGSGCRKRKPFIWKVFRLFRPVAPNMWDRHIGDPFSDKRIEPLVRLIQEVQPNIVILYDVSEYFSILQHPMHDVPVIPMHHYSARDFTRSVNTRKKVAKINTCPYLQVLQYSFIPEIQKNYHGKIHVIANVVPQIEEKNLANLAEEKSQRIITMISRLVPKKQQHLLIQAFGQLAKDYPDWKVEIYGSLSESKKYPRQLKKMIASLSLTKQVELMGTTNDPLGVLRKSDIFAFPSHHPEGWGLALTEAMAVGLPCVGLKSTPSVNELIVDGVNGFLTDNTPEDFAAKLKILMDDQNLRVKMGRAGHEMMKQYAPEKIWDQWENLITSVVQQHQQRKTA